MITGGGRGRGSKEVLLESKQCSRLVSVFAISVQTGV